ncbi:MAG: HDIG domain-containing protein [Opitutales bacterium]
MTRKDSTKKRFQAINEGRNKFRPKLLIGIGIILGLALLCNFICFFHSSRTDSHLFVDRLSGNTQLNASFAFNYISEVATKSQQNLMKDMVLPSYKPNEASVANIDRDIKNFIDELKNIEAKYLALSDEGKSNPELFKEYASELKGNSVLNVNSTDLKLLITKRGDLDIDSFFDNAIKRFKDILKAGIYEDGDKNFAITSLSNFNMGNSTSLTTTFKSEVLASRELRWAVNTLGLENGLNNVLFNLLSPMLRPNIVYDEETTLNKKSEASAKVEPIEVYVREGEVLFEPSMEKTPLVRERLAAYRKERIARSTKDYEFLGSLSDFTISIFLISAATLFIIVSKNPKTKKKQTIFSMLSLFLINLTILRLVIDMLDKTDVGGGTPLLLIFSYALPILIAPLCQVLIVGAYTGFIMSLLLSAFSTIMLNGSIEYFVIVFVSSLITIYYCENAKSRSRIMTGGAFCGLALAFGCLLTGFVSQMPMDILLSQSITAFSSALFCSLLVILVLPLVERAFNTCSNITLFELTDFNHNVLYRLQLAAPGTFHHAIMVAQLAESAAKDIKVNDLLCRVGALYHDVGKIAKPEFFTENQRDMGNPHDSKSPSMSALIIKNHVKEGIEIAKMAKLPKVIVDMISEHHGTTLIQYFHDKAKKLNEANIKEQGENFVPHDVEESTYRYDEQKPSTAESTILMLADSCEAASRSLKKISPQSTEDLISKIINAKMADGQLDNSPVTAKQLSIIKASFVKTILNINHTRVAYPDDKKE